VACVGFVEADHWEATCMREARRTVMLVLAGLLITACSQAWNRTAAAAGSPYGPSSVITGIAFEWHTHKRRAPGNDNWPITWSADGPQYTA
jgi:hypothetical protein